MRVLQPGTSSNRGMTRRVRWWRSGGRPHVPLAEFRASSCRRGERPGPAQVLVAVRSASQHASDETTQGARADAGESCRPLSLGLSVSPSVSVSVINYFCSLHSLSISRVSARRRWRIAVFDCERVFSTVPGRSLVVGGSV